MIYSQKVMQEATRFEFKLIRFGLNILNFVQVQAQD